ncbi:hypothetical protein F7734_57430 [Scytonema sp. UIC 10036]|uniref:effector-associated domain EAD1-containing protein n=1 Tax=Scytonema sp. UIC 10036 TaxID=2304196 RepID=UPI0012DA9645|nr:effector-associated domain EAD1-containing protein [Scytonema sp. UIC 10036]MUH01352.1 hypothetical protein [Scytonema sp. UIC 10036]
MTLTGKQREQLKDALISAFPDKNKLEQMVSYKLDENLDAIAGGNNLVDIVYALIKTAESGGWVEKLIRGARELNRGNSKLLDFEREFFKEQSEGNSQQDKEDLRKEENSPVSPTPDSRQAVPVPKQKQPQQRWAFLVGVNKYNDSNFGQLKFCVNDVLALEKILTQLGYVVKCLHDERNWDDALFPTRDNVEARLKEMCKAVRENDLLWVHFACHGTRVEREASKKEPVLIMRDTQYSLMEKRALPVAEVEEYMRKSEAQQLVLTLDACHTGVEMGRSIADPEFIKNVYESAEGFALLAASTAQQVAWEDKEHGVFTYYLLDGLSGKGDRMEKNFVTVDDLKNHVLDGLRRWNFENHRNQEPTARTEGFGDMILADYQDGKLAIEKNREPELDTIVNIQKTNEGGSTSRPLSKAAALKKENLEKRLANLKEEYTLANDQINITNNAVERNRLQKQADDLYRQMEKIESEINQIGESI